MKTHKITIIGGGIVGLATARTLLKLLPGTRIVVLEKEAGPGLHQSTHNSGVLHCGLYYKPDSLKAKLAVRGISMMTEYCQENAIPHEICGKVVIATDDKEVIRLKSLHKNGIANGLQGLRWLTPEGLKEIEPHASGKAALHVPQEGIVDYNAVCLALVKEIKVLGGNFIPNIEVNNLKETCNTWEISSSAGMYGSEYIINCAGLHCDRVAQKAGIPREARIVPFRGEYFKLTGDGSTLVKNLIYPVPDPEFPFLGVHFTRMILGGIEAGPNAVLALSREGYRKTDLNIRDLFDSIGYKGLWRFMHRYPKMVYEEIGRSLNKNLFARSLQKLVPAIEKKHLGSGGSGVRAQAMLPNGTLMQDFMLIEKNRAIHVLNAPSPAATSSLAIGEYLAFKYMQSTSN